MIFYKKNFIKLLSLLLLSLVFITQAHAEVPNYALSLSSGCSIKSNYKTKEAAVEHYLTGNWVINQLKKSNNNQKVIELTYDYDNYLNNNKPNATSLELLKKASENESLEKLKMELMNKVINDFAKTVLKTPTPEKGNKLNIVVACERLVPLPYAGVKSTKVYSIDNIRPYNAPLELAELRLAQGMDTLVVLEYYLDKSESKLRVINSGQSNLQDFSVSIDSKQLLKATIPSLTEEAVATSQLTDEKTIKTTELSGLSTYTTKLLGKKSLLNQ